MRRLCVLGLFALLLPVQVLAQVVGHIDTVFHSGSNYSVVGWACVTGMDAPINVHLYAGGAAGTGSFVRSATANLASSAAVAANCQSQGTAHRFAIPISAADRQQYANQAIYVHGISPIGPNLTITGSGAFTIPAPVSQARRYTYDQHQRLCKTTEPETGATLMGYDNNNNVAWSAAGLPADTACDTSGNTAAILARKVSRNYDARNRIATLSFPDGLGNTSHTYTPDSKLASITVDNGGINQVTTNYAYNKRRLPTSENMIWDSRNWSIYYAYNGNGALASKTSNNVVLDYSPNALGQATRAGTFAAGALYFPNGALKQFTYGNGIVHTLTQNARQLPDTSRDAVGATEVLDDGYDYDANGNVAAISDGLSGAHGNRTMTYDGLDRLKTTVSPMYGSTGATFSYDVLDNLRTVKAPGRDHTYVYDGSNRLTNVTQTIGGASVIGLGYDPQGNLSQKNSQDFDFDFGNRLRSVTAPGSITSTYVYDGHGRRVGDITGGAKYSLYSQTGELTFVRDMRKGKRYDYVTLAGSLVAIRTQDMASNTYSTSYQHTDALGSPVVVTDSARVEIERSEYEPYGKLLNRPVKDGPGYTGHVEDAATGLTYMQQRYYDPTLGRFLSVDPVTADGNTGGNFNRYWYANNNPYKFTDPDGRLAMACAIPGPMQVCIAIGAVVVDVVVKGAAIAAALWVANEALPTPEAPTVDGDPNGPTTSETTRRGKEGADGGQSEIAREKDDKGRTTSTTHTVRDQDGNVVHGHTDHHGENGSRRSFNDDLTGKKTVGEGKQEPKPKDNGPRFPREPIKDKSRY